MLTKTIQEELRTVADDLEVLAKDVEKIRRNLITDLCDEGKEVVDDNGTVVFLRELQFTIDDATASILWRLE